MRASQLMVLIVGSLMAGTHPVIADPLPDIDWEQFEESLSGPGDHVVGEELCVRQAAPRLGFEAGLTITHHLD